MAFPAVQGTGAITAVSTAATSHPLNMPSSIVAGELLIACCGFGVTATVSNWNGFTAIPGGGVNIGGGTSSVWCGYKIAAGGDTLTVTSSTSAKSASVVFRVSGHHTSTAPEGLTADTSSAGDPDPPSLDPAAWGAEDTLWIAVGIVEGPSLWTADAPTNYTNIGDTNSTGGGAATNVAIAVAYRQLNASSENPGAFNAATNDEWAGVTIAIRPAPAATPLAPVIASPYPYKMPHIRM